MWGRSLVVDGTILFFTSNARRYRTLLITSLLHHTEIRIVVTSTVNHHTLIDDRNVRLGTSTLTRSISCDSISVIVLPNNVPNAPGLTRGGAIASAYISFIETNEGITTVYTTPDVLTDLNLLRNEGTATRTKFRSGLTNTVIRSRRIIMSNDVAADCNLNNTVPFTLRLIHRLTNPTRTSHVRGTVTCQR